MQEIRRVEKDIVEFTVPQDYEVYYLPDPVKMKIPFFDFVSNYYHSGDGKVRYEAETILKVSQIMPEEYPKYKNYTKKLMRKRGSFVLFRARETRK
ncbi:MAG TPA: hypothetical protein ENF72_02445 [Thermococcus litoralis]|uniref:Uncharacterized protein n=1 Tax=Thermococcus litoralis TaxID=2265 RepID=A0A7C0TZ08_THELI|nr:hypothetical protein [Thermococcus litoralis]